MAGLSILFLLVQPLAVAAADTVTVALNAPAVSQVNSSIVIPIDISQVKDLNAANYRITYDSAMLTLDKVSAGMIGSTKIPVGDDENKTYKEVRPGVCNIINFLGGVTAASGSGTLAILHFRTLNKTGLTEINIAEGVLSNNEAVAIQAVWKGTTTTVSIATAGNVTEPTTTPTGSVAEIEDNPPVSTGVVNLMEINLSSKVNNEGRFIEKVTEISEDDQVSVTIESGNTGYDADGDPLTEITVDEVTDTGDISIPANFSLGSNVYDFGPDGATFAEPITITISYDPSNLPEDMTEEDLYIAWYDASSQQWVKLECTVDTLNHTVSAQVSHFTEFAVIAQKQDAAAVTTPAVTSSTPAGNAAEGSITQTSSSPSSAASENEPGQSTNWTLIIGIAAAVVVILLIILLILRRRSVR